MSRNIFLLIILILLFNLYNSQNKTYKRYKRHPLLFPNQFYNISKKNIKELKFHSKLLQTVYSDSFSKNYYYTTLYVGHNKVRQTYIIDTGSLIMSSPCSICPDCGSHKKPYYYDLDRMHKPLKCSSKICKLVAATTCSNKRTIFRSPSCSYDIKLVNGEGLKGYFIKDVVYFETDRNNLTSSFQKKVFRSYALPIGCTTGEYGKYKELNTDGIMGMNNHPKSFISLLYNLNIINRNLFTLCFGLRGGYMSLGEIDTTFHRSTNIEYIPLLSSNFSYLVRLNSLKVGDSFSSSIKNSIIAKIDTGNTISYFPNIIYRNITKQFINYCEKQGGKCGNFSYYQDLGYCASFHDRASLFKALFHYWPNITLHFGESEYLWKPINYYYYNLTMNERKACLGFNYHSSTYAILGANFIHGYDIIFDRQKERLGFVPSDCSRRNLIWNRLSFIKRTPIFEITDPILMDKELHLGENESKFHLGDNDDTDMVNFIQGHNTELDIKEFKTINFIILLVSIIIVVVVVVVVMSVLFFGRKKMTYEQQENENQSPTEIDDVNNSDNNIPESEPNKITFEDSTPH